MAHFAKISENNIVEFVVVVNNEEVDNLSFPESEPIGIAFCQFLFGTNTTWAQTSYNSNFRYNYAGIGYFFDYNANPYGAFIPPKPYESWLLDTNTFKWAAPIPMPNDEMVYYWDENKLSWVPINNGA